MNRPTMEDVAERAKVSRALVSLVMNNSPQVSNEKRRAVLRAARELGYRPNLVARNLAQQRTHAIGVLVDDFRNPFFGEVVDGIEAVRPCLGGERRIGDSEIESSEPIVLRKIGCGQCVTVP